MSLMKTRALLPVKIVTALCGIGFNPAGACLYGMSGIVGAGVLFALIYFYWTVGLSLRLHAAWNL